MFFIDERSKATTITTSATATTTARNKKRNTAIAIMTLFNEIQKRICLRHIHKGF